MPRKKVYEMPFCIEIMSTSIGFVHPNSSSAIYWDFKTQQRSCAQQGQPALVPLFVTKRDAGLVRNRIQLVPLFLIPQTTPKSSPAFPDGQPLWTDLLGG